MRRPPTPRKAISGVSRRAPRAWSASPRASACRSALTIRGTAKARGLAPQAPCPLGVADLLGQSDHHRDHRMPSASSSPTRSGSIPSTRSGRQHPHHGVHQVRRPGGQGDQRREQHQCCQDARPPRRPAPSRSPARWNTAVSAPIHSSGRSWPATARIGSPATAYPSEHERREPGRPARRRRAARDPTPAATSPVSFGPRRRPVQDRGRPGRTDPGGSSHQRPVVGHRHGGQRRRRPARPSSKTSTRSKPSRRSRWWVTSSTCWSQPGHQLGHRRALRRSSRVVGSSMHQQRRAR